MSSRKHKKHDEHIDETWLIPYADLLTLLLALFIVLFASSTIDTQKYNNLKEALSAAFQGGPRVIDTRSFPDDIIEKMEKTQKDSTLEQLKIQLDQYISENNLTMVLETHIINDNLLITIRDYALFDSGRAEIKPEFRPTVVAISTILDKYSQYEVVVSGHTDNVPINNAEFQSNWDLSSKRALNFMKLLLQNENLDPYRFSAIGYGEYRPIAENDTPEGRAQNRRVEVAIKEVTVNNQFIFTTDE